MIKSALKIFFLISVTILFYSCSKDDAIVTPEIDTATNFKYPYSLNSNWFFTTTPNYTFHPDSIRNYISGLDTAIETGFAIWKNDSVLNGITARVLRTNHTSTAHAYNTTECYVQTDTGLVNLSFVIDEGTSFGPFRPNPNIKLLYNEKEYFSIEDLKMDISGEINSSVLNNFNCIKYPITPGDEWFFRNQSALQTQRKKYLNYEQVQTPTGTFNSIKIQRKNYTVNPEELDSNFISFDYFSKVGMIKRSYKVKNIALFYNSHLIGYFDIGQEVVLNSYDIAH